MWYAPRFRQSYDLAVGYHCFFVLSSTRMQIFSKKEHHMAFFFPIDLLGIIL